MFSLFFFVAASRSSCVFGGSVDKNKPNKLRNLLPLEMPHTANSKIYFVICLGARDRQVAELRHLNEP